MKLSEPYSNKKCCSYFVNYFMPIPLFDKYLEKKTLFVCGTICVKGKHYSNITMNKDKEERNASRCQSFIILEPRQRFLERTKMKEKHRNFPQIRSYYNKYMSEVDYFDHFIFFNRRSSRWW